MAFILLLSHINTSMFFPVVEEVDFYDAKGRQINDVNSVVEFIVQDLVAGDDGGNVPADDEDNDQPNYFQLHKGVQKVTPPEMALLPVMLPAAKPISFLPDYMPLPQGCSDIIVPPPKA